MNNPQSMNQTLNGLQENVQKIPAGDRPQQNPISRVWDIVEKVRVGMLTTQFSAGLRGRPLEARVDRDNGILWFVTDVRGAKDEEIDASHDVGLTFVDENDHAYLSITARAFVTRDNAKSKEIWRPSDNAWFPAGPDDPNVRVLRIQPITAELWDGLSPAAVIDFKCTQQQ